MRATTALASVVVTVVTAPLAAAAVTVVVMVGILAVARKGMAAQGRSGKGKRLQLVRIAPGGR